MTFYSLRAYANRYQINDNDYYIKSAQLTKSWIRGFEVAKEASVNSDLKPSGIKLGAAIFSSGRLLAVGYNLSKTRPENVHRNKFGVLFHTSTHAEQMAIDQIKHRDLSRMKLTIYVARVTSDGKYGTSKPCASCIKSMKECGIKIVRFINENGIPEEMVLTP